MIMKDAITKRSRYVKKERKNFIRNCFFFSRGFGFITFKDANAVDKVLAKDVHMLDEKQVCNLFKHQFDKEEKKDW